MEESKKNRFAFISLDSYIESHIVSPDAVEQKGKDWCRWGEDNDYPDYCLSLVRDCTTLSSIINGVVDYIVGDDVISNIPNWLVFNSKGETARDIVRRMARNFAELGGVGLEIIPNESGGIAEIYVKETKDIRTDKERQVFVYSEAWQKGSRVKYIVLPKYIAGQSVQHSIYYATLNDNGIYPQPLYASAVKSCEVERSIDLFHLNSLQNGFMGSYVFNFCNGIPDDEEKAQIERDVNEKFGGASNAGRIFLNFADTKDTAMTIEKMDIEDYGAKYETLAKRAEGKIYEAFRANPNLFGLPTAGSNGFNQEEYDSTFRLFNRTMIRPIQRMICDIFDKLFDMKNAITIKPFTMDGAETNVM